MAAADAPCPRADDLRLLIDGMEPEEKILVLEYFAGSDPDGLREAAREARKRYERADGYRDAPDANAVRDDELDRLRSIVADYENTISWDTTCREHARLLDECRRQEERAEQAEAALASARNLCARSPLCIPERTDRG